MISPRATWHRLNNHQRSAALGAVLLVASTVGPFSFVEGAIILVAVGVLVLIKARADGRAFHLPFGDGTMILVAGVWCAFLTATRLFARPLSQSLLALASAALVVVAGAIERSKRPADDLPSEEAHDD